ncbi:MAG: OB-fold domain-containing protein [Acidobacteria bacterium]|nr:OB-fold domain-containing protein [Acidobacteriota bacterium]
MTSQLPLADIEPTIENQPFWDALRDNRIDLPYCQRCRSFVWYPRAICPLCHQGGLTWRTLPGTGHVYSQTVVTKGTGRWKDAGPYVVAYVQLDSGIDSVDGPRILTNIVGDNALNVSIGSFVCSVVDRSDDANRFILRFALA